MAPSQMVLLNLGARDYAQSRVTPVLTGRGRVPLCIVEIFGSLCRNCLCVVWRLSVRLPSSVEVALSKCSSPGRPLGAYNLGITTPRALVYAGLMTSGMLGHGKWMVLEIKDVHPWRFGIEDWGLTYQD
ncbi:hypothetical protein Tco_0973944 [Tanacetum coccineum]|uniref:Uncharacterized protein n=1 Tax=Tanacetum coccineum TaxID=301880 RepID=A0ABQ5EB45_9ASTR